MNLVQKLANSGIDLLASIILAFAALFWVFLTHPMSLPPMLLLGFAIRLFSTHSRRCPRCIKMRQEEDDVKRGRALQVTNQIAHYLTVARTIPIPTDAFDAIRELLAGYLGDEEAPERPHRKG